MIMMIAYRSMWYRNSACLSVCLSVTLAVCSTCVDTPKYAIKPIFWDISVATGMARVISLSLWSVQCAFDAAFVKLLSVCIAISFAECKLLRRYVACLKKTMRMRWKQRCPVIDQHLDAQRPVYFHVFANRRATRIRSWDELLCRSAWFRPRSATLLAPD